MTSRTKAVLPCFLLLSVSSEQERSVFIGVHVVTTEAYDLVGKGSLSQGQPDLKEYIAIIRGWHSHRMKVGRGVTLEAKGDSIVVHQVLQKPAFSQLDVTLGTLHLVGIGDLLNLYS
jgi:hypothetical protein